MPEWLEGLLEQRTRYERFDTPWQKGQSGGQDQIPPQTELWLEGHHDVYRAGFEFWDARQFGAEPHWPLNNTMVNVGNLLNSMEPGRRPALPTPAWAWRPRPDE